MRSGTNSSSNQKLRFHMTWKKQYLARKTPSDNFLSDILDRYSLKRYEEKFGSIDTAVTSGFS
jgi:hypothetical protein